MGSLHRFDRSQTPTCCIRSRVRRRPGLEPRRRSPHRRHRKELALLFCDRTLGRDLVEDCAYSRYLVDDTSIVVIELLFECIDFVEEDAQRVLGDLVRMGWEQDILAGQVLTDALFMDCTVPHSIDSRFSFVERKRSSESQRDGGRRVGQLRNGSWWFKSNTAGPMDSGRLPYYVATGARGGSTNPTRSPGTSSDCSPVIGRGSISDRNHREDGFARLQSSL